MSSESPEPTIPLQLSVVEHLLDAVRKDSLGDECQDLDLADTVAAVQAEVNFVKAAAMTDDELIAEWNKVEPGEPLTGLQEAVVAEMEDRSIGF